MQKSCDNCKNCNADPFAKVCTDCRWVYENGKRVPDNWEPKVRTMADRIRAMDDEELAKFLVSKTFYKESAWSEPSYLNFLTGRDDTEANAIAGTIEWLKKRVED